MIVIDNAKEAVGIGNFFENIRKAYAEGGKKTG